MRKLNEVSMVDSEATNLKSGPLDVSWLVQEAWKGLDGMMINTIWKHIGCAGHEESNLN